jgi:RND superfamily putative drug exporter
MLHNPLTGPVRRAARAASRAPKTMLVLWLVLVAGLITAGSMTAMRELSDLDAGVGESGRADRVVAAAGLQDRAVESVLVRSGSATATAAAADDLAARVARLPEVAAVRGPDQDRALARDGGRTALVQATLRGDPADAADHVDGLARAVDDARAAHPGADFDQAGPGTFDQAIGDVVGQDLLKAEVVSIPLTLLILVLAAGAIVAALLPLALALTAVAGAMGALSLVSLIAPVDDMASSLITLIGLAVGVDYSLFAVRRFREELAAGRDREAALDVTAATVGRAIVVAGLTVVVALSGLLLTGLAVFQAMALGTMLVVLLAVLGAVTALPAMLTLAGPRLARRAARRGAGDGGPVGRVAAATLRRPALALGVAVCALGVPAVVATQMDTAGEGLDALPASVPAVQEARAVSAAFPGAPEPAQLVVAGRDLQRAPLERLGRRATVATGSRGAVDVRMAADRRTAVVGVPLPGDERGAAGVRRLRDEVLPGALPGATVQVTGLAARNADFSDRLRDATPVVIGLVLALAFVLLVATFRSPWLAVGVIALNLLSVGAAYGVVVGVFQHTWAEVLLGFSSTGTVVDWVPLFAFVILFGLSMDYTILVLERVREARRAGLGAREAAAEGIRRTAGSVTVAALVMVAVFAVFASLRLLSMKQLGLGLAAAIVVDATVVRAVALPAFLALLGERRWRVARWDDRRRAARISSEAAGAR